VRLGTLINRLLRRADLELVRRGGARGEYSVNHPFGYDTYSPWLTDAFDAAHAEVRDRTLVSADRLFVLERLARQALSVPGDFAECGVYKGGTAFLLARLLRGRGKRLHLFDTFEGMPASAERDPSGHRRGDFGDTSLAAVQAYLAPFPDVTFHRGFIPETFAGLPADARFSFVHVDVDLYASVRDCLAWMYPRLAPGGILVFDDYGFAMYRDAARRAVDEFFADRPEVPLPLRTGQCVVHRLGEAGEAP
jgi:O-methyltransferase